MRLFLLLLFSLKLMAADPEKALCPINCLKYKDHSEKLKKCYDECKNNPLTITVVNSEKIDKILKKENCIKECEEQRKTAKNQAPITCLEMCSASSDEKNIPATPVSPIVNNLENCTLSVDTLTVSCPFGVYYKNKVKSDEHKIGPVIKTPSINESRQHYFIITILLFAIIILSIAYIRK